MQEKIILKPNFYNRMEVNINALFDRSLEAPNFQHSAYWKRLLNRFFTGALIKLGWYVRLVDAGIIRNWFVEFEKYWSNVLEGRPLYMHDFFFLLGIYRQRFQDVETPDSPNAEVFLDSWQNHDTLYMLFGAVRLYAYHPLGAHSFEKWIHHGDTILEYGCGIAPITHFLLKYSLKRNLKIDIADIRQINSHYAKYRFGRAVNFLEIQPFHNCLVNNKYQVVFMITVMEHLPDPLETVKRITASLKSGGILVFDYILGDGDGQDTIEAVTQRGDVLDYIIKNYDLLDGKIQKNISMSKTVRRKKNMLYN